MKQEKTHAIFWRRKSLVDRNSGSYDVIEYRAFKAVNANTLRRLRGEGWGEETKSLSTGFLRTPQECQRAIYRLNMRQAAELDEVIDILKKEREELTQGAPPAPTTASLLFKPVGRGH